MAAPGRDGALSCKTIVTYCVSDSSAYSGLANMFHIADAKQKYTHLKTKNKQKENSASFTKTLLRCRSTASRGEAGYVACRYGEIAKTIKMTADLVGF